MAGPPVSTGGAWSVRGGPRAAAREAWQRGFVLHRRDYGNSSLLLDVFTAAHGRLPLLAKGAKTARRGGSARAALLQAFQPLWLTWSGRGEVATLTRAEAAGMPIALAGKTLYCGLYLNELLLRLLGRHDPHEALFVFYQQALAGLGGEGVFPASAATDTDPSATRTIGVAESAMPTAERTIGAGLVNLVLRRFELHLLQEVGYQLDLTREADTGVPIDVRADYAYHPEQGLVRVVSPTGVVTISGDTLQRLATGVPLNGEHARAARDLLRLALAPHLGERPLKSRELFRQHNASEHRG
ncbi:MAG: DNA repair protein RecO [Chromatiaceae bacterium]|nr:MAG: DNA repair protein RecO [Chromatiaceae bacterium]